MKLTQDQIYDLDIETHETTSVNRLLSILTFNEATSYNAVIDYLLVNEISYSTYNYAIILDFDKYEEYFVDLEEE